MPKQLQFSGNDGKYKQLLPLILGALPTVHKIAVEAQESLTVNKPEE